MIRLTLKDYASSTPGKSASSKAIRSASVMLEARGEVGAFGLFWVFLDVTGEVAATLSQSVVPY